MYQTALDTLVDHRDSVLYLNHRMEEKASVHDLNEEVLVHFLDHLDEVSLYPDNLYWLSLARINELAILCAGNYAENCEFTLVGDLLVNPRLVLVHVRGGSNPIVKKRHMPLTEQFQPMGVTRGNVIQWLKKYTIVENRTEALMPYFLDRLRNSGLFRESYLASIKSREEQVADLTAYLACQRFGSRMALDDWCEKATPADRNLVKSRLCRFDFRLFELLGKEVERAAHDSTYQSIFLKSALNKKKQTATRHFSEVIFNEV